ncbi:PH domain-containing protein [Halobacterium salinarum]|uniref:PH domain-containing protein n=1 Tax=Halobacterium salinarum TaxID=2242 RepID=UPI0025526001|nr:PH domain-containing protein [Halobacterium salinarum]MDL0144691.1 PH domain-containing protein [Halobacterium salinarum]
MQKDLLATNPVISYLRAEEQPEHFFYNDTKGVTRNGVTAGDGNDASYRSLCIVTDERLLFFTAGSKGEALPIGAVSTANASSGHMKHRLTINTSENEYMFYINNSIDGDEVQACAEYIEALDLEGVTEPEGDETSVIDGLSSIWEAELDETPTAEDALKADPQGGYVTRDRFEKVKGVLDPGEKVHFITRGSTVDVEGSSAGESLFGDDRSRKSGTSGWVRAVITDQRVAIKIPQVLGNDERSVPYSSLTSVDLDTGLVNKRLTLQTPGQTYHVEVHEPGKDEVRRASRFIRQQVENANQPDVIQQQPAESEPDPLDQIEKLKDLNSSGAISDEEFEEKKQDLLDKL